jgi:receptor protein-tyrosine kinase
MELSDILQILNRRKWIIIVTTVATLVTFYFLQSLIPTTYEATSVLRIVPYSSGDPSYTQLIYAERIMNTYEKIASSSPLLNELRERLRLAPEQPNSIEVVVIPDTELLSITVEDSDPVLAREAANTLAEMLVNIQVIREIRISIVEPATAPEPPSSLRIATISALALILGLLGGTGLAFLFENLDTRLHTTEQIKAVTGVPILSEIPNYKGWKKPRFMVDNTPYSDIFRRLRVNVLSLTKEAPLKTILITSAEPNEGKSTIVANLARSLAQTGRSIIVVDGDLHCPTIHTHFDVPNKVGLSSLLETDEILTDVLINSQFKNLKLLPSGPTKINSAELLDSEQMIATIEQLKSQFDLVLLDSPAFLGIADTAILAPYADGVILVARRGAIKEGDLRTTCQQLMNVQANMVGVIVNNAKKTIPRRYYKYYHQPEKEEISEDIALDMDTPKRDVHPEPQDYVSEGVSHTRDEIADADETPSIYRDTNE